MRREAVDRSVPHSLRGKVEEIIGLTDAFCAAHLDAEYAKLCRQAITRLARKRPSPLERGAARNWAGGAIHAVGSVNFLFDPAQTPHLSADELSRLLGMPKSTLANKSKALRDALDIGMMDPTFTRRDMIEQNPLAWLIQVNSLIVDARTMPPEVQAEARRLGLIPDLAALDAEGA